MADAAGPLPDDPCRPCRVAPFPLLIANLLPAAAFLRGIGRAVGARLWLAVSSLPLQCHGHARTDSAAPVVVRPSRCVSLSCLSVVFLSVRLSVCAARPGLNTLGLRALCRSRCLSTCLLSCEQCHNMIQGHKERYSLLSTARIESSREEHRDRERKRARQRHRETASHARPRRALPPLPPR